MKLKIIQTEINGEGEIDIIGGSPIGESSRLTPEQVKEIINEVIKNTKSAIEV